MKWRSFVEKPNLETAQAYVASGEYLLEQRHVPVSAPDAYLEELKKYRPDYLDACEKAMSAVDPDLDFHCRVDEEAFSPARKSRWIYAGHGTYGRCRCGADGCGLERCRLLVLIMGNQRPHRRGQRLPRRCD
ncbi:mannose-1-phosphate guanylyltransferase [Escherichia coli]|uniref:Mannose-1-phosphate guanylyltransferase n=1 Tax=Escherichia coli TaxID=562 RepID=A0A2X1KGG1_ECOLX|nr:mannose-1-phosphate guanylyltransferase [Escherichia coli]